MSTSAIISAAYTPAEAERGKFAVIDSSYLQTFGYPASGGYGRYAIFTYQVNPSDLILSGGNVTVSSVQITNDVVIDHIIDPIVVSAIQVPASAYIMNNVTIGAINDTIVIDSSANPVAITLSTTATLVCSVTLTAGASAGFVFTPFITLLEMYNNGTNKVYFQYTINEGTWNNLTQRGMVLDGESYYGMEKNIAVLTVASISGSDVRIFAHRR